MLSAAAADMTGRKQRSAVLPTAGLKEQVAPFNRTFTGVGRADVARREQSGLSHSSPVKIIVNRLSGWCSAHSPLNQRRGGGIRQGKLEGQIED